MLDAHGPKGVVMNIYGEVLCNDIFDRKCNGINGTTFIYSTYRSYIQYICKCSRKFNISYPQIQIDVCAYRGRRRGWELRNVIFQEILCTYKDSLFVKIIFTLSNHQIFNFFMFKYFGVYSTNSVPLIFFIVNSGQVNTRWKVVAKNTQNH